MKSTKTANKKGSNGKRRWLRKLIWSSLLFIVIFVGLGAVVIISSFDKVITSTFEGKKWQLPSHVYARALELYVGAKQSPQMFKWELQQLGYRQTNNADVITPGLFSFVTVGSETIVEVHTRGFEFWDGTDAAQLVQIRFNHSHVVALNHLQQPLSIIRFEPLRIGGIYPSNPEDRHLIKLENVPDLLPQALITVEDQSFYHHYGISIKGIIRAFITNIKQGRAAQGGSTITQQLVKNFYLNNQRHLKRKIREAIMALILEYRYSKDDILETYLNEIYFGQAGKRAIHGVGLASHYFFKQPVNELNIQQIALLVGMIKGPENYNPWRQPDKATQRRNLVLNLLLNNNVINQQDYDLAIQSDLGISKKPRLQLNRYPVMMDLLRMELKQQFDPEQMTQQGLSFYTSLDPQIQKHVDDSVEQKLNHIEKGYKLDSNSLQAAAIVTRIGTGEIVAVNGNRHAGTGGFNRAINAIRPIGSLIKPFTYMSALQQSDAYRLSTLVDDTAFTITASDSSQWSPQNYDKQERGPIALIDALAYSLNLPAARVGLDIGIDSVVGMLHNLGVERPIRHYPSTLLGAAAMSPLDIAVIYHSLASDGFYVPLTVLRGAYQGNSTPLTRTVHEVEQRLDPSIVFLIKTAMHKVFTDGTARSAYKTIDRRIKLAGKTGTTDDLRDSWIAAFGGNYSTVIWVGRDNNKTMPLTSVTGALPIWTQIMAAIESESITMHQPRNIIYQWVDLSSDSLSAPQCEQAQHIPFIKGSQPTKPIGACAKRYSRQANKIQPLETIESSPEEQSQPSKPWWKQLGF